jgi:hypothetical protein
MFWGHKPSEGERTMMKGRWILLLAGILGCLAYPAVGQARPDVFWARTTASLNLDGVLDEPAWAAAESMIIVYGQDAGIPGSGYKVEAGVDASDPTHATLKFLTVGNQLYLGAKVHDRSIGGSKDFNRFDGFLMALKDHASTDAPKPPAEYFYSWWYPNTTDPQPEGQLPGFVGKWGSWPPDAPRTPEQIDAWDARTVVHGLSNSDAQLDTDYTVEMRFNLTPMGYHVNYPEGDVVEWNIAIYDTDWFWPIDVHTFSVNRVWWQSPWGNTAWFNQVYIYSKPSVTINSGPLPADDGRQNTIPNGAGQPDPVIDGALNEAVWSMNAPAAYAFELRYGDEYLRRSYPGIARYRAGQFQPDVLGHKAAVTDPGNAKVRWFFKGTKLYLAFDVLDQVVQYHANFDRWDGFIINVIDRVERVPLDHVLQGRRLTFQVGPNGEALPQDYLLTMVQAGTAQVAISLRPGTVVDTLGVDPDFGYTAEVELDLTALGYPADLGDRMLFIGVNYLDGDSFTPSSDSYGTRTWWMKEFEGTCCPAWAYLDPNVPVTSVEDGEWNPAGELPTVAAYPNPARAVTLRYSMPSASAVSLEVFDVGGRLVHQRALGVLPAGETETDFDGSTLSAGLYYYRLRMTDPQSGSVRSTLTGHVVLVD